MTRIKMTAAQLRKLDANAADPVKARKRKVPINNPLPSPISFTIRGIPRTKKTHNRIFRAGKAGRLRVMPSEAYEEWFEHARFQLTHGGSWRFTSDVNVSALFYRAANVGDAVGYYQALADLLERSDVLANDRQIRSWDGSRLLKDAHYPRIEVTVTPITEER